MVSVLVFSSYLIEISIAMQKIQLSQRLKLVSHHRVIPEPLRAAERPNIGIIVLILKHELPRHLT